MVDTYAVARHPGQGSYWKNKTSTEHQRSETLMKG